MFTLHASGIGGGIAIGIAQIMRRTGQKITESPIARTQVDAEIERLNQAALRARETLQKKRDELADDVAEEIASLLGIHLMILADPRLIEQPSDIIRTQKINAEAALARHADNLGELFKKIQDPYLSGKSADVAQVIHCIQGELSDSPGELSVLHKQPEGMLTDKIIVANDLTPADAVELKRHRVGAFITNLGGPISHTAILARSMRIPAIVGMRSAIRYLRNGDLLVVDGKRGVVLVNPHADALATYERRRKKILRRIQELDCLREAEATTLDGEAVALFINIEFPEEISACATHNAHGVGLYRTEYLFMNQQQMPAEAEQFAAYAEVAKRTAGTVTIRTLDIGADKQVDGGRASDMLAINPALGLRAIRLCLHDIGLFKPQLRAIYRASAFGEIRIMVPMISNLEELDQLFALLRQVQQELREEGHQFNARVPVGGMIEVPAAAISADLFAHKLDFLSIGTNDLIQYTLAIDRTDDSVNYLYDPLHPSVLRLIQSIIAAGKSAGIPVSMCGEMAGETTYTRLLLGMGLREFSMEAASLLEVKQQIRLTDISRLKSQVATILQASEAQQIRQMVDEINA